MIEGLGNTHITFWGISENRNDPEKLSRIQVRIFGHHSQNAGILPTELLPWAQVLLPTDATDSTMSNIQNGTLVHGFFLDGEDKQIPMVTHVVPGKVSPEVRHYLGYTDKTLSGFADGRFRSKPSATLPLEPNDPYAAVYPFNHVSESESGHVIELDDTPGAERVHVFHKAGSFIEIHPDGSVVKKSVSNSHDISAGDSFEYAINKQVQIDADYNVTVKGNAVVIVEGDSVERVAGNKVIEVGGTFAIKAGSLIDQQAPLIKLN